VFQGGFGTCSDPFYDAGARAGCLEEGRSRYGSFQRLSDLNFYFMWFFLCFFCFYNGFLYFYSQELSDWIIRIFLIVKESLWKWLLLFYLSSYHFIYYLSFSYLDLFSFGLSFSPHFLAFTFPDFFILSDLPPLSLNFPLSLLPFPRPPPNFPHSFPNLFSFNFRYI
jgi:hypothetical protein